MTDGTLGGAKYASLTQKFLTDHRPHSRFARDGFLPFDFTWATWVAWMEKNGVRVPAHRQHDVQVWWKDQMKQFQLACKYATHRDPADTPYTVASWPPGNGLWHAGRIDTGVAINGMRLAERRSHGELDAARLMTRDMAVSQQVEKLIPDLHKVTLRIPIRVSEHGELSQDLADKLHREADPILTDKRRHL